MLHRTTGVYKLSVLKTAILSDRDNISVMTSFVSLSWLVLVH
jgi:hypothetical protein